MGPNGCQGNPEKGDTGHIYANNIEMIFNLRQLGLSSFSHSAILCNATMIFNSIADSGIFFITFQSFVTFSCIAITLSWVSRTPSCGYQDIWQTESLYLSKAPAELSQPLIIIIYTAHLRFDWLIHNLYTVYSNLHICWPNALIGSIQNVRICMLANYTLQGKIEGQGMFSL